MVFYYGEFEVDEERFELRRRGKSIPVQRRVLETIFLLARSGGKLVTKEALIAGPWNGLAVSDGALNQAIMLARRVLTVPGSQNPIATVRGKGFRFLGHVTTTPSASAGGLTASGSHKRPELLPAGASVPS